MKLDEVRPPLIQAKLFAKFRDKLNVFLKLNFISQLLQGFLRFLLGIPGVNFKNDFFRITGRIWQSTEQSNVYKNINNFITIDDKFQRSNTNVSRTGTIREFSDYAVNVEENDLNNGSDLED